MKEKNLFLKILGYFTIWRVALFLVAILAGFVIANFGGRFPYVDRVLTITNLPNWIWGFGNFDGVHYLRIAQNGYSAEYVQSFFPLYPFLIKIFNVIPKTGNLDMSLFTDPSYFVIGIISSNIFFVAALYFLFKLWKEEYSHKSAVISIFLLLSFPTAFYFGAVYTESLFLLLAVLTFWFARKDSYMLAGLFAALASATKVQGALLSIYLGIELIVKYRHNLTKLGKLFWRDLIGVAVAPLGIAGYMYYLYRMFGNPLYFLTALPSFGTGRSSAPFTSLPQVIYRYIKIFWTVDPANIIYWNAAFELLITLVLVGGLIIAFKKIKLSYWVFVALAVIVPTLTGTLTSMPRYALLAFPLLPLITRFNKGLRYIIIAQAILQVVLLSLFVRGYWVA